MDKGKRGSPAPHKAHIKKHMTDRQVDEKNKRKHK